MCEIVPSFSPLEVFHYGILCMVATMLLLNVCGQLAQ